MRRRLRKHRIALIAVIACNAVLFFPTLFMQRVISPNDVFYNYPPWASLRTLDVQNSMINDPPTSYLTLIAMLKHDRGTFHWNPYVGGGIPGFGSSASAVLSPFILIPALLLAMPWIYTGIIFLKLNVAFFFAYGWLREERLGKRGAAVGAILFAASGAFAVRWLWQATNATALYPALLWIVLRVVRGKRTPVWLVTLIALAYALAGFPATMAYGAYLVLAYFAFLVIRERRLPALRAGEAAIAVVLALAIASPSLVPFVQFVLRTGYLGAREQASLQIFFPRSHFRAFIQPDYAGNPAYHNWTSAPGIGNYVEATVYLGLIALPLVVIGLFFRRARQRWFWLAALVVIAGCMFGLGGFPKLIARLPGFKYSPLTRLQVLLPVAVAYLAASGAALLSWLPRRAIAANGIAAALALAAAGDLGVFAGRFHPYLDLASTKIPITPTIRFLRAQQGAPFRIAPMFDDLWPNSSELFGLEDIRSHFSSEETYRRILQRIDPTCFSSRSTVLQFNSLKFGFNDPFVSMLGVRYFIEQSSIDIIKWKVFDGTVPGVKETGSLPLLPGTVLQRTIRVDAEPFWAIELPVSVDEAGGVAPHLLITLWKNGVMVEKRVVMPADIAATGKVYVPVRPHARLGESVTLRVQSIGIRGGLLKADAAPNESPLFYGRVTTPVIFDRQLPDGRLFRNLAEVPRFHAVTRARRMTDAQLLTTNSIDFADEAVISDAAAPLPATAPADVALKWYAAARQDLIVQASGPAFVASSEKLTPELRVSIDDREVQPVRINILFAGVPVPAGTHHVVFERRIGRGWWWVSAAALLALFVIAWWRR